MRATSLLLALVVTGAAWAAPRPGGPSVPEKMDRELLRNEARRFAGQLLVVVERVSEEYYRPVSREELLLAGLSGLYQAARQPVPRDLAGRIRRASAVLADNVTSTAANIPTPGAAGPEPPLTRLIREVREEVGPAEALRGQNPLIICCQAMARSLDPHSGVVTAEEQQKAFGLDQECEGLGLELADSGVGPVRVESVQPGSPAQRVGIRPGDVITQLNGKPVRSAGPAVLLSLRNRRSLPSLAPLVPEEKKHEEPSKPVEISFRRTGDREDRSAELRRERFHPETVLGITRRDDNSWSYFVDAKKGIAHVRLAHLAKGTSDELREVLFGLKEEKLAGLILDLRWCPGGYLNESVETADLFLGEGTIATLKSRLHPDTVYRSTDQGKLRDFPVVVLVNGETSGGAELIAAALQDHRRARIVGQRTVGKASVQTPLPLEVPGVALKLTSGTFTRPAGKNLHRSPDSKPADDWGVYPDGAGEFRISADLGKRLKLWWQWQTMRPGKSRERLPLDDPRADPQQQAALQELVKMMEKKGR